MQRILKRAATLHQQEARKIAANKRTEFVAERLQMRRQTKQQRALQVEQLKFARNAQRQDWRLGSLAPNRNYGKDGETFGGVDRDAVTPFPLPEAMQIKDWNIVEGDRVVLLRGLDKGQIGIVKQLLRETNHLIVNQLNMAYQKKPELFRKLDGDTSRISPVEVAVKYEDVRLIHTMEDPRTGTRRDVIVDEVEVRRIRINKNTGEKTWVRFVPGTDSEIEWPYDDEPDLEDHHDDTLRLTVDKPTFVPTLLTPPMPPSVIDELRGKYSKYRTRHDEDYIARQVEKEQQENAKNNWASTMRMPIQLLHEKQRADKAARGEPQLTEDMLARIGELMAANRAAQETKTAQTS
ncbi:uncharacterized protein BDZ99DRAFT_444161 [Mytilinidion resinicola]|uniref:KOW domain-containing protein n=1 Tax=Mytilinidion resinicola TaxID=574789 RepID=A0A6A6YNV7_9PEZI|nr:uncharacterized protein BDZ99DRAFT_444161 [Mytilinidion resinicola]KAF2809694.1 hypothetical protein BDZ99DRAFT_444161 [Mytilinidion resinicola]